MIVLIVSAITVLAIFSYGFIDPNLQLTGSLLVGSVLRVLGSLAFGHRLWSGTIFTLIIAILFFVYVRITRRAHDGFIDMPSIRRLILFITLVLLVSFPAFTYDLFNYMATAKVAFTHRENPYVVMPIEIPNDPILAYTRAANKVALYGPTWIALTAIPHALGAGNVWREIVAFKMLVAMFYLAMCFIIWRVTKSVANVAFFALNPLVLVEVLVSGHNDIVMMVPTVLAVLLVRGKTVSGVFGGVSAFIASVFVKGAVLPLAPLLVLKKWPLERVWTVAYWIMFTVFAIFAPLREELYPWYAVWFITFAALLPWERRYSWLRGFTIACSVGLELRHVPYMVMGYYEGPGPMLRIVATAVPIAAFLLYMAWKGTTESRGLVSGRHR